MGSLRSSGIEPFHFGTAETRLLGIYQPAQRENPGRCGVVLCYPMGREYLLAHRSFRQLANQLSQAGFPVLRFDFHGCGDSYGTSEEGSISHWLRDLSSAVVEMRKRSASRRICLVGLRLGATLAITSATERHDIDSMVLWNPVLSGAAFLNEMRCLHNVLFKHLRGRNSDPADDDIGLLGFRLTQFMQADLEKIDLYANHKKPAPRILVVQSEEEQQGQRYARHLSATGAQVDSRFVAFAPVWTEGVYRSHVPAPVLAEILSWITEVNA